MSDLLALSFDADASPSIRFRAGADGPVQEPGAPPRLQGWGVGWYPDSEGGASVVKDPTSSGDAAMGDALRDWQRFRSTLFICHLRSHKRTRQQQDAQPFVRTYGGHQWIFAHDGDLRADYKERLPLGDDPAFEPLGTTDSEHAFCWLLSRMHAQRSRSLSALDPGQLHGWLSEINYVGELNMLLSDGDVLAVHRDAASSDELYWTRRLPPHERTRLESDALVVDMNAPEDPNRTALVFSSEPLTRDVWLPMAPSQLVLARRGSVVYDSHPKAEVPMGPGIFQETRAEAMHQVQSASPLPKPSAPARPAERRMQVTHETHYSYTIPVERSSHRFLLCPLSDRHQDVESHQLQIVPPGAPYEYEDVFGNAATGFELTQPYSELSIRATTVVRVREPESFESRSYRRRDTIPLVWMPWQRQMLSAYLMPPELPETQLTELSDFAMSFVERNGSDLTGSLLDMNETLYRDFEYVSGSTTSDTTPFEVFESRRGVCQDFANLMICLARLLNVPARYRMGYIFTGADYQNKVQSDASHAWVELYVPRVGWHGFDPTNGREAGSEHVRVACGRNYRDATPTSGTIYRGGGTETLTISVRVEPLDGQS